MLKTDRIVTRDERQDIRQDERQASRAIYRQKHNDQVRRRHVRCWLSIYPISIFTKI